MLVLSLSGLALTLVACASAPVEYATIVVYEDVFRFSFEYPTYYTKPELRFVAQPKVTDLKGLYIDLLHPQPLKQEVDSGLFLAARSPRAAPNHPSPADALDDFLRSWDFLPGFRVVDRSARVVSGFRIEEATYYTHPGVGQGVTAELYLKHDAYFDAGNVRFRLWWQALPGKEGSLPADFEHLLESFRLLD